MKRDRELEAGATAHFEDPAYYAQSYATRKDDVAYYGRVAKKHDRVLEYGIGNGRIAIPMARAGATVVGIDQSRAMLADLRERISLAYPAMTSYRLAITASSVFSLATGWTSPICIFGGNFLTLAQPIVCMARI